jgi:hypothetical protein
MKQLIRCASPDQRIFCFDRVTTLRKCDQSRRKFSKRVYIDVNQVSAEPFLFVNTERAVNKAASRVVS